MRTRLGVALAWAWLACACGDGESGPKAVFQVPDEGPIGWGMAPFPSDLMIGSDGFVDLGPISSEEAVWEDARLLLSTRRGFCGTCAVYFPIEGEIDPATVADGVALIDMGNGARLAADSEWNEEDSLIAVRPSRGVVMTAGGHYAAALTDAIRAPDGGTLRADGGLTGERASAMVTPALAAFTAAGIDADSIVAVSALTIDDAPALSRVLREAVIDHYATNGAPTVVIDEVYRASDGSLETLMGTPAEDRPGLDVAPAADTEGTRAVVHATTSLVVRGRFRSVRVIEGTGTELGRLRGDAVAGVQTASVDDVPFFLAVPIGADVTNLPVAVFHHGAGGQLAEGLALVDTAGRAGVALLALEHFQHGSRAPSGFDEGHRLRGDGNLLGPDGFYEHNTLDVAMHLFAVNDAPAGQAGSPVLVLGTMAQMVTDLHALLYMMRGDLAQLAAADPSLAGLDFDADRTYLLAASLGTIVSTTALSADEDVDAAVLAVPVSSLLDVLCDAPIIREQTDLVLAPTLEIPSGPYEPERRLIMQPLMMLLGWVLSPIDPIEHVTRIYGPARDVLWQLAGGDEHTGTLTAEGLIAIAGAPAAGDQYQLATIGTVTPPWTGSGAWRFPEADHLMHVFNTGTSFFTSPDTPPFERRLAPTTFANPTGAVHDQLTHFLETREIAAP